MLKHFDSSGEHASERVWVSIARYVLVSSSVRQFVRSLHLRFLAQAQGPGDLSLGLSVNRRHLWDGLF